MSNIIAKPRTWIDKCEMWLPKNNNRRDDNMDYSRNVFFLFLYDPKNGRCSNQSFSNTGDSNPIA